MKARLIAEARKRRKAREMVDAFLVIEGAVWFLWLTYTVTF